MSNRHRNHRDKRPPPPEQEDAFQIPPAWWTPEKPPESEKWRDDSPIFLPEIPWRILEPWSEK